MRALTHVRQRGLAIIVGLSIASMLASCGAPKTNPAVPGLSLEGQIAVKGRQLIAGVTSAASGVDVLMTSQVLPKDQGINVLQKLRLVSTESQKLADLLTIIDTTRDAAAKQTAIKQAGEIVKGIQKAVTQSLIPIGTVDARTKVAALLDIITADLVDISLLLPRPAVVVGEIRPLPGAITGFVIADPVVQ